MEKYKTTDLGMASYLYLRGHKIETDKSNPRKIQFVFEKDEVSKDVNEYILKKSLVDPMEYFNAIKTTKNFIYGNF